MNVPARGPVPQVFLALTALLCGAMVMAIEILGARVIGPFFGASLFVWTAVIAVTLVALAAGYAIGGLLADGRHAPRRLYLAILAAGLMVLLIPALKVPLLRWCGTLGLRTGSLVAATLLFGAPLLALGCVSPMIARLAMRTPERAGRAVGSFYALSTLGSLLGTIAAGYFLLAWIGVNRTLFLSGTLLVCCALWHFVVNERRPVLLALVAAPAALLPGEAPVERVLEDGTRAIVLSRQDSLFGDVRVIEYAHGALRTRELVIDGLVQGGVDAADMRPIYEFPYLLTRLPVAHRPGGTTALAVGLGPGSVPAWFARRGVHTEVVEINPRVIDAARRHFALPARVIVHEADARAFLASDTRRFDYLIVDAYSGDSMPAQLFSAEAMDDLRARLAPAGVIAFNLHGSLGREASMTLAVLRTIASRFPALRVYRIGESASAGDVGNLIVIAAVDALPEVPRIAIQATEVHPLAAALVGRAVAAPVVVPPLDQALLLTDDHNPLELFDLANREAVRRGILESTDWSLLLG